MVWRRLIKSASRNSHGVSFYVVNSGLQGCTFAAIVWMTENVHRILTRHLTGTILRAIVNYYNAMGRSMLQITSKTAPIRGPH